MLLGRSSSMRALGTNRQNPVSTSALDDAGLAKRLELQKAIERMERRSASSNTMQKSRKGSSVSRSGSSSTAKVSTSSPKSTSLSGFFDSEADMTRNVSRNPVAKRRSTALKSAAKGSSRRKGVVSSLFKAEGSEVGKKSYTLSKANIKTLVNQIALMKKQYEISNSPAVKKKLDRAVAQLGKLQAVVRKDLDRLDEASKILAKANPKKGGSMTTKSNPKKKSTAKTAARKKTSSAIYEKLLADLKKARAAKAAKKGGKKSTARRTSARKLHRNPLEALDAVLAGLDTSDALENGRRRKRKAATTKKTTVRKATRRNPGSGLIVVGSENPRKKRKTTAKKTTARKVTRRRNPGSGLIVVGSENPRKKRKTTAKKTTARKVTRRRVARRNAAEVTIRPVGGLTNPRKRKRKATTAKKTTTRRRVARRNAPAVVKDSFTFTAKNNPKRKSRKASTRKTTTRRRTARRNPSVVKDAFTVKLNPKRRSSSIKRKTSTARRTSSVQRRAGGLSRSVVEALRHFGPDFVTIHRGGRNTTIKAQTSSAEYKQAKAKGLYGRFSHLSGKKNTPYSLNVRSLHSMVGGTPSVADIQKAVNVWAGAHAGGHLGKKKAAANPAKRRTSTKRKTATKRKTTATRRRKATKAKSLKSRRKSARRNPSVVKDSFTVKLNPKKRKTSSKKRKTSSKKGSRRVATKRKTASKKHHAKKRHARRNPVQALRMNPTSYALMHHNPLMPTMGSYGVLTASELRGNPEASMGMKLAVGAGSFLAGMVASNTLVGMAHGDNADTSSSTYMLKEYGIPAALGVALAGAYHATAEENRTDVLKVGVASAIAGIAGSVLARNVVSVEGIFAKIPGLNWLLKSGSEGGKRFNDMAGYIPTGRFLPEPPAATLEGYMADSYQGLDGYSDMGRYGLTTTSGYSDMGRYGLEVKAPAPQLGAFDEEIDEFSFDDEGLDGYIPTGSYGDFADDSEQDFNNEDEDDMRSSLNGYHTTGALVPMAENTEGFVLSSQNVKAPTRIGAEGLDIQTLAQELKEVEALDVNARKAEGLPDVENVDVAIIRATPYYARVIADSNLGYILKQSSVVKGSYVVGLYVGPDSLLFNTGMGARDLNIPHGARTARPAGIFTNTIFSSVLPAVDGNVVWAGGDEGDF